MIDWHAGEHNWSRRPTESGLFGKPIVEDPTLPVGTVYFKPGKST